MENHPILLEDIDEGHAVNGAKIMGLASPCGIEDGFFQNNTVPLGILAAGDNLSLKFLHPWISIITSDKNHSLSA